MRTLQNLRQALEHDMGWVLLNIIGGTFILTSTATLFEKYPIFENMTMLGMGTGMLCSGLGSIGNMESWSRWSRIPLDIGMLAGFATALVAGIGWAITSLKIF